MTVQETEYFPDRDTWRRWLQEHHATRSEVWLLYYKVHTGRPSIPYDESVEEALCFGWIDGKIRSVDDDCFARRFTPRKPGSQWSELNIGRVRRLVSAGRMTEAGMRHVLPDHLDGKREPAGNADPDLPPELERELRAHAAAWAGYTGLSAAQRRLYVRWITDAKKPETRRRRLEEAMGKLERGEKIGMK